MRGVVRIAWRCLLLLLLLRYVSIFCVGKHEIRHNTTKWFNTNKGTPYPMASMILSLRCGVWCVEIPVVML
jgi:hypothetical protein